MSLACDVTRIARPQAVAILRAGILARDWCRRGGDAEVAAVFERSFYLRAGDMFLCVGVPAVGNGPLTLIADIDGAVRWSELGLRSGRRADISARHIAIGDTLRFNLEDCEPWCSPGWPQPPPRARLTAACAALTRRAGAEAPAEGLAQTVFGAREPIANVTSFSRIARGRIASFESWLSAACRSSPPPPLQGAVRGEGTFPHGLIGLGPGLTPSGDDFLSGALALLDARGEREIHAVLGQRVIALAAALTSPLSACLLRAAADGHIGEHLHRAVASLISGDIDTAVAAARRIGHSSGWDMLAGAATTLRIVAQSLVARTEPASARGP